MQEKYSDTWELWAPITSKFWIADANVQKAKWLLRAGLMWCLAESLSSSVKSWHRWSWGEFWSLGYTCPRLLLFNQQTWCERLATQTALPVLWNKTPTAIIQSEKLLQHFACTHKVLWVQEHKYKNSGRCCQHMEQGVSCFAHSWVMWAGLWHCCMRDWVVVFS